MAERAQLQYTPVVGPVWTEPVAEKLAWLPSARQPARALRPHRLGWYARPEFEALYRPDGLQWTSSQVSPARSLAKSRRDWTVLPELVAAPSFDPQRLEWLPGDRYAGRSLPRARSDWTVFQQPIAVAAFDPGTLEWIPKGAYPLLRPKERRLGDFAHPARETLYRPEGLGWQPEDSYFGRRLRQAPLDWTVFQRPIVVAFDPQTLDWQPRGLYPRNIVERRILGAFVQPPFAALYSPDRMEWVLSGLQPQRTRPTILRGQWVTDPTPLPFVMTIADDSRTIIVDHTGRTLFVDLAGRTVT